MVAGLEGTRERSLDTIDRTLDLRLGIRWSTHGTGKCHHAVSPPRLGRDGGRPPWTEPCRGWRTINRKSLIPCLGPLWWQRFLWARAPRRSLEQLLQLLAPLVLLLQKLLQLLLAALL